MVSENVTEHWNRKSSLLYQFCFVHSLHSFMIRKDEKKKEYEKKTTMWIENVKNRAKIWKNTQTLRSQGNCRQLKFLKSLYFEAVIRSSRWSLTFRKTLSIFFNFLRDKFSPFGRSVSKAFPKCSLPKRFEVFLQLYRMIASFERLFFTSSLLPRNL